MNENRTKESKFGSFEFQNWDVYKKSIQWVSEVQNLTKKNQGISSNLLDQIQRASTSIPLNISEGSSRYTAKDKINFLRIARGSVFECVAILDVLKIQNILNEDEVKKFTILLSEIGRMISGLINWINKQDPREGNP